MANKKSKYNYKKTKNTNNYTYDESNYYNLMSEADIQSLKLLYLQAQTVIIVIYAYIIFYIATIEGIQLIYEKYNNNKDNKLDSKMPDGLALKVVYIFFITQIIFTNIAINRYNILYKEKLNGEFEYSLQPNIYIIISSLFSIVSDIFLINGAEGVYARDISQPIFGI